MSNKNQSTSTGVAAQDVGEEETHPEASGNHSQSTRIVVAGANKPHWFVRFLYFLFIGWWLGFMVSAVSVILIITIIGLPAGIALWKKLDSIMFL